MFALPGQRVAVEVVALVEVVEQGQATFGSVGVGNGDHASQLDRRCRRQVLGNLHPFGEPTGPDVVSRYYDSVGNTFDYVYELDGDTLTIWGGAKGSPAYYKGTFDAEGTTVTGEWVYPGGGGYASTMTRI